VGLRILQKYDRQPGAPLSPNYGQFWHQTGSGRNAGKIFRWTDADWAPYGYVVDSPAISKQGKQECSFMAALASAQELAWWTETTPGWNKGPMMMLARIGSIGFSDTRTRLYLVLRVTA
jgi:hypothetical protein